MLSDYELTQDYHSIYTLVHQRYMHQYEALTKERGIKQIELYKINDKYDACLLYTSSTIWIVILLF